jgi:Zn-dependent peptidase ImmA (M78 family)
MDKLELIHYNTTFIGNTDESERLIVNTIARLPNEVQEEVMENVIFLDMGGAYGNYTQYSVPQIKFNAGITLLHIISLNLDPIQEYEEKMYVIAHEIAHFIFRHTEELRHESEYDLKEGDADRLIKKWGFTIPNRRGLK